MKLSCNVVIYFKEMVLERTMSQEDWFKQAAGYNLLGTEIYHRCMESHDPAYIQEVKAALKRYGLVVSQYSCSPDLCHPDPAERAEEVRKLKENIAVAAQLGAPSVRVTAGQAHPGLTREQGIQNTVESLRECLAFADQQGVYLAYENHYKDYFWDYPDFSQPHDIFLEILNALRDTSLKVNFDCSNPIMNGEDPIPLLKQVVDRVVQVHSGDRATYGEYTHAASGEGLVNYPALFEVLQEAGYNGWLSVEYNRPDAPEGLARSFDYIRATWNQVRRKRTKPVVQVSLDVETKEQALELAETAVRAGVDWIEAGTPYILGEGLHGVRALRERFPDKPIIADLKTMDGGYLEAEMMAKAGANFVVVMGVAHPATIKAVVQAARDYNIEVMGDIMAAPDKVACAQMMERLGVDYIIVHTGFDERRMILGLSPLDDLETIVAATNVPIQAVGGLSIEQAIQCASLGAPLVVIGAPLAIEANAFAATSNVEEILREIVRRVKATQPLPA
jgi:3-hexulose-6-phosphate synthase/6-phospho-3-hexuloisomerase